MAEKSRRELSDTSHSMTIPEGFLPQLPGDFPQYKSKTPSPTEPEDPRAVLKRYLSVDSTPSSLAERMGRAAKSRAIPGPDYRAIGLGSCGSVFEIPGTEFAIKKGKDIKAIWNDFCLTNAVHNAISNTRDLMQTSFPEKTIPKTPFCSLFRTPNSTNYWETNVAKFPTSHREPGTLFQVDRIMPVPQPVRESLIEQYFEEEDADDAKSDEDNKDCLIRIYLGENQSGNQTYDSLRNFPLRLNMIEELGLDKTVLADEMAIGLAICHWQAQVDAMDAEFVLGSAQTTPLERRQVYELDDEPHDVDELDFTTRPIHIWLLDFDKSTRFELTPEHVEKYLVPAFLGNDPYYPRPDVDADLWTHFKETYIKASRLVLRNKRVKGSIHKLPELFVDKVVAKIEEHKDWNVEDNIVFG